MPKPIQTTPTIKPAGMSDAEFNKIFLSHPLYAEGARRKAAANMMRAPKMGTVVPPPVMPSPHPIMMSGLSTDLPKTLSDWMKFPSDKPAGKALMGTAKELDVFGREVGGAYKGIKKLLSGYPRLIDILGGR